MSSPTTTHAHAPAPAPLEEGVKKSFQKSESGRRPKSPTPGVAVPEELAAEGDVDPAEYDPRQAAPGTPIGFPDPDAPYPTDGEPYPPPEGGVTPPATAKGQTATASRPGSTTGSTTSRS